MNAADPTGSLKSVGLYELIELIGEGDIGQVHTARNRGVQGFDKRLAIKLLRTDLAQIPGFREAFVTEARLAASLSHSNIVQVVEIGEEAGLPFIVMEHVQGMDLARCNEMILRSGRSWPAQLAAFVAAEVAMGLDHAHRRRDLEGRPMGIVHQDITPSNVLMSYEGAVKITDFGMAGASGEERLRRVGHPRYLAPEQVRGEAVDPRTDVYGCGLLLYEMLAGRPPLADVAVDEAIDRLGLGTVPVLGEQTRAKLDPNLLQVLSRATAPWPDDRYEDAAELYEALMSTIFSAAQQLGRRDLVELLEKLRQSVEVTEVVPADEIARALGSWSRLPVSGCDDDDDPTISLGRHESEERSYEQLAADVEETRTAVGSGPVFLSNITAPPMRGRERERRQLGEAITRAASGERRVVEVIGPQGIGKTRLMMEVIGRVRAGKAPLGFYSVSCRTLPHRGRFSAASAILRAILGLKEGDDARMAEVSRRLRELGLARYEREALQDVVGVGPGKAPPGPGRARATGRGLARVLRRLSEEALTVVFFDDADDMDSDSARLLSRVIRYSKEARVLIVLARRDEISPWPEPVATTELIQLTPLSAKSMERVISDAFNAKSIAPQISGQFLGIANGNPRLACELARLLSEVGAVVVENGAARLAQGASLPHLTLSEIIDRRLDLRSELEKVVLESAACVGSLFETKILAMTTALASDVIATVLEAAMAARLIVVSSPSSCAFAHELIRDRIIDGLSEDDLRELHARIAEAMASIRERRDASWRLRCANHLRRAGQRARARDLLATSAAQLETMGATDAAIDHFSAALELTKGQDEIPVALALALRTANLALRCGRLREGLRAANLAIDLAQSSRSRTEEIGARVLAGRLEGSSGRIEDASNRFREALAVAEQLGDVESQRKIRGAMGELLAQIGDYHRAVAHLEEAIADGQQSSSPRFLLLAAMCRGRSGEAQLARNMLGRVAQAIQAQPDPAIQVGLLLATATLDAASGQLDQAIATLQDCRELARAHGLHHDNALASHYLGATLINRGRPQRAFASLRYSYELAREHGFERLTRVNLVALMTLDVLHTKRPDPIERIRASLQEARDAGYLSDILEIRYYLSQALIATGQVDEARAELQQASRAGRATGNLVFHTHISQMLALLG